MGTKGTKINYFAHLWLFRSNLDIFAHLSHIISIKYSEIALKASIQSLGNEIVSKVDLELPHSSIW